MWPPLVHASLILSFCATIAPRPPHATAAPNPRVPCVRKCIDHPLAAPASSQHAPRERAMRSCCYGCLICPISTVPSCPMTTRPRHPFYTKCHLDATQQHPPLLLFFLPSPALLCFILRYRTLPAKFVGNMAPLSNPPSPGLPHLLSTSPNRSSVNTISQPQYNKSLQKSQRTTQHWPSNVSIPTPRIQAHNGSPTDPTSYAEARRWSGI